jgi:hypothetical protein
VTAEVDVSSLPEYAIYSDVKCKELQGIIREYDRYSECIVRRKHFSNMKSDPFLIQDAHQENLVLLHVWEIDTLEEEDLITFIDVQIKLNRESSSTQAAKLVVGALVSLTSLVAYVVTALQTGPIGFQPQIHAFIIIVLLIVTSLLLGFGYREYRVFLIRKEVLHADIVKEYPNYSIILQKLASLPDIEEWARKSYASKKRSREILLMEL